MDDPMDSNYDELFAELIAVDVPSNIKEFMKKVTNYWLENFEKNTLNSSHFEVHWKVWVPKIYSPPLNESCLNWNFNEDLAQDTLLNTLDDFICNGDSSTILNQLGKNDKKSSVSLLIFTFIYLHIHNIRTSSGN